MDRVVVFKAPTEDAGEVVRDYLIERGVDASIRQPIVAGLLGRVWFGAEVTVPERQMQEAEDLIRRVTALDKVERCSRCGYNVSGLNRNVCPECGTRIIASIKQDYVAAVPVARARNETTASLVQRYLEIHGIDSGVVGRPSSSVLMAEDILRGSEVLVAQPDRDRAAELLEELLGSEDPDACLFCGADFAGKSGLERCPACGALATAQNLPVIILPPPSKQTLTMLMIALIVGVALIGVVLGLI